MWISPKHLPSLIALSSFSADVVVAFFVRTLPPFASFWLAFISLSRFFKFYDTSYFAV